MALTKHRLALAAALDYLVEAGALQDCSRDDVTMLVADLSQQQLEHGDVDALAAALCEHTSDTVVIDESPPVDDKVAISFLPHVGWCVVRPLPGLSAHLIRGGDEESVVYLQGMQCRFITVGAAPVADSFSTRETEAPVRFSDVVSAQLRLHSRVLTEGVAASLFIGLLALATSLYSMHVYDRVIPTRGVSTLLVLSAGVLITIMLELAMKIARSSMMDHIAQTFDSALTKDIFARLLRVRVDRLPPSVGSLAGQIRGYEQVRSFYTASTLFALVDFPLALLFLVLIGFIATPLIAVVPAIFAVIGVAAGLAARRRFNALAGEGAAASNLKVGLLVETVEGIETIKLGGGARRFIDRWMDVAQRAISNDLKLKGINEVLGHLSASLMQLGYVTIVACGAVLAMQGSISMGALIACSILSGRILSPVLALPGLIASHAHCKAAAASLENLYALELDNHAVSAPLKPKSLKGRYWIENLRFRYEIAPSLRVSAGQTLDISRLSIAAGERVGILGPIGSGKSTLLKLLAGLYKPSEGRVLLDQLSIEQISMQTLAGQIGYLQQEHRLFLGTLRENLLVGLPDPGDDILLQAMARTGFDQVVASHERGLDRLISEGGRGLSGGQRQLLALTRLLLSEHAVLLLDEPTASLDDAQEKTCLAALLKEADKGKTLVVVTHKPSVLCLVERLVVIADGRVVMDGPKEAILQALASPRSSASPAAAPERVVNV